MKQEISKKVQNFLLVFSAIFLLLLLSILLPLYSDRWPLFSIFFGLLGIFVFSYGVYWWHRWYGYNKHQAIGGVVLLIVTVLNLYFYYQAYRMDIITQRNWEYPSSELSSLFVIMEYLKAGAKMLLVDGVAIVAFTWYRCRKNNSHI